MDLGRRKEEAVLKGGSLVTSVLPKEGIQEPPSTTVYAKSDSTTPTSLKRGRGDVRKVGGEEVAVSRCREGMGEVR